jgi:PIN domain nuclease of toxin-antitoxin system
MRDVVADTHAVVSYLRDPGRLSPAALRAMEKATQTGALIHVSAISLVEVTYLIEKGRVPAASWDVLIADLTDPTTNLRLAPVDLETAQAVGQIPYREVPDLPDRIVAATALRLGLPLITRDARIRSSRITTIW